MQMTFRWYGEGNDRIKLSDITQIPGVSGIVWALHDKMPGEVWEEYLCRQNVVGAEWFDIVKEYEDGVLSKRA